MFARKLLPLFGIWLSISDNFVMWIVEISDLLILQLCCCLSCGAHPVVYYYGLIWTSCHFCQVAKDGLPLPPDRTLCPLCCQKRNNPSVLSVSGFVFCYSCIFKSVSQVDILLTSHSKQPFSVFLCCISIMWHCWSFHYSIKDALWRWCLQLLNKSGASSMICSSNRHSFCFPITKRRLVIQSHTSQPSIFVFQNHSWPWAP
jgi:hypothetical protein